MQLNANVTPTGARARILVAEDDVIVGQDIEASLEDLGYHVPRRVRSGQEAVRAARELEIDLVLMDIRMPGRIDGIEAARIIREEIGLPVVFLTGYSDDATVKRAKGTDPQGYLLKPYHERELKTAVELAIHRHRLEERDRVYQQTVSSLDEAVLIVGPSSRSWEVLEVNAATERIFGYDRSELIGSSTEMIHVTRDAYERFDTVSRSALEKEGVFRGDFPMRRKDGTVFQAEQTLTLLNPSQGFDGRVVGVVRDVSRRKEAELRLRESEERFRLIAERIEDVFRITTPGQDRMEYVSPAYELVMGYPREELYEDPGRWFDHIHPDDRDAVRRALPKQAEGSHEEVYRIVRADGEIRWILDRAFPVHDDEGKVLRIIGVAEDITEHKELEKRLVESQKMEAVGRLAGGIAHDFNNLLTVVRSQSDLLLGDLELSHPMRAEIGIIRDAADRAAELTTQLLTFASKQVVRPRIVDLNEIIRNMGNLLARTLGEDVRIETALSQASAAIHVDPGQVGQVIMNLAVNARDAMPAGGVLSLSTRLQEVGPEAASATPGLQPGPHVRLEISDTGVGMDEAALKRVFEPFYTTKETTGGAAGSGLGLATVYGIVQQNDGAIRVESEPGVGTTFVIDFPASEAEGPVEVRPPDVPVSGEMEGTILLVEDDPAVQRAVRRILERAQLTVKVAGDLESALGILDRGDLRFDLVVTDVVLPGASGLELLEQIRQRRAELPVICMSGYAQGPQGRRIDLPPDVPFLQKPFTAEELLGAVREQLTRG